MNLAKPTAWAALVERLRVLYGLGPVLATHALLLAAPFVTPTLASLALFTALLLARGLAITVGYHRYFAHRSFATSRAFQFLLALVGCTALQNGPLWWAAHHRRHHAHSDRAGDVHSPVTGGVWFAHIGWLFSRDPLDPDPKLMNDFARYPELLWLDRLWVPIGLLPAAACYLIDGWAGVVYGFGLSAVVGLHLTFSINSVCHLWGSRRYDTADQSRNNWLLGYVALGEGWHNNHHHAPRSAALGHRWYEYDSGYLVILGLEAVGLVWDVKRPRP